MLCLVCQSLIFPETTAQDGQLCCRCRGRLVDCSAQNSSGRSLFEYSGLLRALILRVKISGDFAALRLLCDLFLTHPLSKIELEQAASVMVVPSSFWGRIRGKIDLAWFLGHELACEGGKPFVSAPTRLFWQLRKQALARGRSECHLKLAVSGEKISTLIIDDVITTGYSISRLSSVLGKADCRFLTLASAFG